MKIHVVDPGCSAASSHHHAMNLGFRESCRQRGIELRCLVNKQAEPEVRATPGIDAVFRDNLVYDQSDDALFLLGMNYHFPKSFADDLETVMADTLQPGDIVLMHTASSAHLFGLAQWLDGLALDDIRVSLVLRFPPNFRISGEKAELNAAIYRYALSLLARSARGRVRLCADSDALAERFSELGQMPVAVAPLPITYFPPAGADRPSNGTMTFLYAGEAREEKGFHLLRDAFSMVATKLPTARFIVQAVDFGRNKLDWPESLMTRTECVSGVMEPPAFQAFLATADVVLVPYYPQEYTYRTSHIFAESMGLGLPVVTTAGSWMDREMAKFDAAPDLAPGLTMDAFAADSLAVTMIELASRLPDYKAAAARCAPIWRDRHNFERFADVLLGLET